MAIGNTDPTPAKDYPFRMSGRIVETYRYSIKYTVGQETENGSIEQVEVTDYTPSLEEANYIAQATGGKVANLDFGSYEWLDGIEVADVEDTMAIAAQIYDMGKEAWERKVSFETAKRNDQLRADLDFVMLMGGLT